MSSFAATPAPLPTAPLDPTKHVKYTLGMVLGVDEFEQEFAYLAGRDQRLARDLLGFGTVCGLRVKPESDARGARVVVEPGTALDPAGRFISVTAAQCAYLNDWLVAHDAEVRQRLTVLPSDAALGSLDLYVVLSYREREVDPQPIPGEPCRTEAETMAASRVADDYLLELAFDPPDDTEEQAIRSLVHWLGQIEVTSMGADSASLEAFLTALRSAAHPSSAGGFLEAPPPESLRVAENDTCAFLRAAFGVWTTELRPEHRAVGQDCSGSAPVEQRVLLARLGLPLVLEGPRWRVLDADQVTVTDDHRPYVLSLRLLQEWLACGWQRSATPAPPPAPLAANLVERPADAGAYAIVAAGVIRCDGTSTLPPYNKLQARWLPSPLGMGQILVGFSDYRLPRASDGFQYIVKALPVFNEKLAGGFDVGNVLVSFSHFDDEGFVLYVTDTGGKPLLGEKQLEQLELMIEVSRYAFPPVT